MLTPEMVEIFTYRDIDEIDVWDDLPGNLWLLSIPACPALGPHGSYCTETKCPFPWAQLINFRVGTWPRWSQLYPPTFFTQTRVSVVCLPPMAEILRLKIQNEWVFRVKWSSLQRGARELSLLPEWQRWFLESASRHCVWRCMGEYLWVWSFHNCFYFFPGIL